jgi:ribosomal protein S18 acetylase RimI-like enzyme
MEPGAVEIASFDTADLDGALEDLVVLLQDAVESGASVGFLGPLRAEDAAAYWRERAAEAARGTRLILVAREAGRVVGSVQLAFAAQQNARHRAEVQRLIVLRAARGRGVATELMRELESRARSLGRTLLTLNTRAGDPPERLYERLGYTFAGRIPEYARNPDGTLNTTSIMFRRLT